MNQLSISPPRDKHRVLGARFDDTSKRWVSTSHAQRDVEVFDCESAYADSSLPNRSLFQPAKFLVGTWLLVLFSALTVLGQQKKQVDIKLSKMIDVSQPTIGQAIKFTVYAKNEGPDTAKAVKVKDTFPIAGATPGATTAQTGTSYAAGLWTIPKLAPGDSVKLELAGTVIGRGVYFNIAEVMEMDPSTEDVDSDPGNGVLGEDDYATACFSVPLLWYPGDEYTVALSVPGYSDVIWSKVGGGPIVNTLPDTDSARVSADTLIITGTGRFAFTAKVNTCPATGCCEIIVIPGPLGSIGDFVWKDVFNNGIQEPGEPGVNNVKVILWSAVNGQPSAKIDSTLTGVNPNDNTQGGYYKFTGLPPGDYIVQIDKSTIPAGCVLSDSTKKGGDDTKDSDFNPTNGLSPVVTLDPEKGGILKDNPNIDGALFSPLGSIGDFVWKDLNDNGQQDSGEPGVKNVKVILFKKVNNNFIKVDSTLTNATGFYTFANLSLGEYQVMFDPKSLPDTCQLSLNQNVGPDATDSDADPITGLSQIVTIDPTKTGLLKDNPTIDAALSTFDLALRKDLASGQSANVAPGATVTFTITVKNEGTMLATNIMVQDSLPVGMTLNDANWSVVSGSVIKLNNAIASLAPGASTSVNLTVNIGSAVTGTLRNHAQISDARDKNGNPVKDKDSTPGNGFTRGEDDDDDEEVRVSGLGSIGDFVWKDLNDNGQQDSGEPGVDGVKVILWTANSSGAPVSKKDSTVTSGGGKYSFTNLPKGDYIVQIVLSTLPDSCVISSKKNVGPSATDNDFGTNGLSNVVSIDPAGSGLAKDNPTIDAGLFSPKGSIGDFVWKDLNDNGQQDSGEPGVDGVKVILWTANSSGAPVSKKDSTVTSGGGKYSFTNLPKGDYIVQIVLSTLPDSCVISSKKNVGPSATDNDFGTNGLSNVVSIDPAGSGLAKDNPTIDAGLFSPKGSIGDFVWKDLNDNGQQDSGEPGVKGVKVVLFSKSGNVYTPIDSTVTDASGKYLFSNLPVGTYRVKFDPKSLPDTCQLSLNQNVGPDATDSDADPTTGFTADIVLTPNKLSDLTIDAALSVFDLALRKDLASGQSANVAPGATVTFTITVKNEGTMLATNIMVQDSLPVGMTLNDANWSVVSGSVIKLNNAIASLAPGASTSVNLTVNIGSAVTGTLRNHAQISDARDKNGNPVKDKDSTPGNGFTRGEDDDDDEEVRVSGLGSIGDFVWKDLNDNGQQDSGEPGVDGVKVILWTANSSGAPVSKKDSTVTSGGGKYSFTNLPKGDYIVQIVLSTLPDSCVISSKKNVGPSATDNDFGTNGLSNVVSIDPAGSGLAKDNPTIDAGLFSPKGSIGDFVWKDLNDNGQQDSGEPGVDGVKVILWTANSSGAPVSKKDSTVTSGGGKYSFTNLPKGDYIVQIVLSTLPDSCVISSKKNVGPSATDNDFGTNGLSNVVKIDPSKGGIDKDNPTIDAGLFSPKGSIGDFVWKDLNDNGQQDAGEPGVKGVKVELYSKTGSTYTLIATTTTDASGKYLFSNLPVGTYRVKFDPKSLPDTCQLSLNQNVGPDATDSDADPTTGFTADIVLTPNKLSDLTIDAALSTFDLALDKSLASGQSPEVEPGATVTFKITVKNEGTMLATNIMVQDSLPVGMTLNDANWSVVSGSVIKLNNAIASLAPGASTSVNLTVKIDANFTGTSLTNFAQISDAKDKNGNTGKDKDSKPGNGFNRGEDDDDSETIRIKPCPIPPTPTCEDAENVCPEVCVDLTKFVNAPRLPGSRMEWRLGNTPTSPLVPDPTKVCTSGSYYVFEVASCGVYSNPGKVRVTIVPCPADLSLTKTVSNKTPNQFDLVTYTLKVSNAGPSKATNIEIVDTLKAGLEYVSGDAAFTKVGSVLIGKIASLNAGTSVSLSYVVKVNGTGTIRNFAQITKSDQPDPDSTPGNGTGTPKEDDEDDEEIKVIVPCPIPPTPTCEDAENVCPDVCVDLTKFVNAPRLLGSRMEWRLGNTPTSPLVPDPTKVCTSGSYYVFEVADCGTYSNPGKVRVTIVPCLTDLSVEKKIVEPAPYTVGQTITYNITAANNGPVNATNVTVSDVLPASLTFVSANPPGVYNSGTGVWTVGNLAVGANSTLQIKATINAIGIITNTAIVKGPNNDPTKAGNDTSRVTIKVDCIKPQPPILACATSILCPGEEATIHAVGCEGGIIKWSNGATGASITVNPLVTTTYTAICVKGGCESGPSNAITINVTTPTTPTISVSPSTTICAGSSVVLTGGNCAGTLVWSTGQTGVQITVTPTTETTYSVLCKIGKCESPKASVTIKVTPGGAKPTVICSKAKICPGESVTLEVKDCAGIVEWSTGQTGPAIVVNPTVTTTYWAVCNNGGCKSRSDDHTIVVEPATAPTIAASPSTTICKGGNVTLTAQGCEGTIKWSNGMTGASIIVSPVATTTYTATCTVGNCVSGESNPVTITIGSPEAPVISADPTLICAGQSTTLTASGTCAGTIVWSNGMTGSTITVSPASTTDYTAICKVANCESAKSNTVKVTVTTAGAAPTATASPSSICAGESSTLTASGCPAGSTYIWSTGATGASITVSPATTTTYTVSCRTAGKCDSAPASVTVSVGNNTTAPTITVAPSSTICAGQSATLTASGCAGGTITWSTGATGNSITVTPATTTTYTAICKVGKCESSPASATVTVVPVPEKPIVTCDKALVCPGGSVTLEAKNCAGTVVWSNGQTGTIIIVTPATTTTYTAVCKVGSCESPASDNHTIVVLPTTPPNVSASPATIFVGQQSILTATGCEGEITWSNGMTGASIIVTPSTTTSYTATCKIGNCISSASVPVTVTVKTCPTPTIVADKAVVCEGESVILKVTSGCDNGTVQWSNGMTGSSITVTPIGNTTYTAVCKKDDCTSDASNAVTVVVTKVSVPTILATSLSICLSESVTLTAKGCEGTVLWSTGQTGNSITVTPNVTTSYSAKCKVGDCTSAASASVTITVGAPPAPVVSASSTSICFGAPVTLTATGDCFGFILWSNGLVGQSITINPAASATYTAICCNSDVCKSPNSNAVTVNVSQKINTPVVVNMQNVCPIKTVDLNRGVQNYDPASGLVLEFRQGTSPSSPLVANPSAIGVSGTYYAFFRTAAGCYSAPAAIVVMISSCDPTPCETNPATADAGADATICAALEYKLNGKIGGAASSAMWTTSGTGTFSNALKLDATYYPSLEDLIKGDVILTLTTNDPDGNGNCKAGKDDLKLIFEGIKFRPQIMINGVVKADTLPQTINICKGDTVKLKASEGDEYQVKWFKDGKVLFPASGIKEWKVTEPGTYSYALVDAKRCCSVPSAYITVNVNSLPAPVVRNLRNTCPSPTVDLTKALDGTAPYTLQFRASNSTQSAIVATPEAVGAGTYFAFFKKDGCFSAGSAIVAKVFDCANDTLRADLSISKTANTTSVGIGQNVTYTIVVTNNGPHTATSVDVRDVLPAELELVSSTGMTNNNGTLTGNVASLASGESHTFTVVAKATKAGNQVINNAMITYADQVDPNTTNNKASATITVSDGTAQPAIGVALAVEKIEKKDNGAFDLIYRVTIKNVGNVPLTDVQVCDSITKSLPANFSVFGVIIPEGSPLIKNPNYDGKTDLKFLAPTGNNLAVGEERFFFVMYIVKPEGNNGPFFGSVVATGNGSGTTVQDASNRGTVVNAPDNSKTPVRFDLPTALIGLSKSAGTPVSVGDGNFRIPYVISVTNLGSDSLRKVQVTDNLFQTFGTKASIVGKPIVTVDAGFVADTTYTGQGLLTKLLVDSLSTLPPNVTRKINLTVTIKLNNPDSVTVFNNIAIGTAISKGGVMAADTSNTGDNADPDNDLDPRNNNESTPVTVNSNSSCGLLGVALSVKEVVAKEDGSANVTYRVILKNYGACTLTNVQVRDSLMNVFNAQSGASFRMVGTPTANDLSSLRINPDFDGNRDVNLLIAEQSSLAGGQLDSLFYTINVTTDGRTTPYLTRVVGTALAGQNTVRDLSTNGLNPDPNGNNNPTEASEAEFTSVVIPSEGTLFIPEGFSPNGDGINDRFVIRHPAGTKIVLEIYNRWMNLVYRHNDYQNDWDGTGNVGIAINNQGLPAGTYFYNVVLTDQNGAEIKRESRFMTINR